MSSSSSPPVSPLRLKLQVLADAAKYDASCASSGSRRTGTADGLGATSRSGICHSYTPDGRCVSLLKILLTNHCIYDCQYCVNRISSDVPRAKFSVEEVVFITMEFYRRNYIEGLFLSSGVIRSPDETMAELAAVAEVLRTREKFNGYIHLKVVPGASKAAIAAAGRWADRLSANIELPTQADLNALAPEKKIADVDATMGEIRRKWLDFRQTLTPLQGGQMGGNGTRVRAAPARERGLEQFGRKDRFAPSGQSTQMIVGATGTSDATILDQSNRLYSTYRLRRVYFSAYSPIPHADSRLPAEAPPLIREHRLYQADWLMRFYGFDVGELTTVEQPNLPLDMDPKLSWALRNRAEFPVDLNKAGKMRLLRVPGLGVRTVQRILQLRKLRKVRLEDLVKLRVSLPKVRPFVLTADHNPDALRIDSAHLPGRIVGPNVQLELFSAAGSAMTGEV